MILTDLIAGSETVHGVTGGEPRRVLSPDDMLHYRRVVTAIAKTIELQAEINRVIAAAGGLPAAFAPA
jgi:hypothetical protein